MSSDGGKSTVIDGRIQFEGMNGKPPETSKAVGKNSAC